MASLLYFLPACALGFLSDVFHLFWRGQEVRDALYFPVERLQLIALHGRKDVLTSDKNAIEQL